MTELHGVIERFDEQRGDGVFLSDEGNSFYFHCVGIRNGSRTIGVGVRARARRCVGHLGRDEVVDVEESTE